tara:strand:+ start:36 stop:488 length:453 start_codon:yes stop_codon:yes gene_type:complete
MNLDEYLTNQGIYIANQFRTKRVFRNIFIPNNIVLESETAGNELMKLFQRYSEYYELLLKIRNIWINNNGISLLNDDTLDLIHNYGGTLIEKIRIERQKDAMLKMADEMNIDDLTEKMNDIIKKGKVQDVTRGFTDMKLKYGRRIKKRKY